MIVGPITYSRRGFAWAPVIVAEVACQTHKRHMGERRIEVALKIAYIAMIGRSKHVVRPSVSELQVDHECDACTR